MKMVGNVFFDAVFSNLIRSEKEVKDGNNVIDVLRQQPRTWIRQ